jgi:hypothetical protein
MEKLIEEFAKAIPSLVIAAPAGVCAIIIVWMILKNGGSEFLRSFKPKGKYVEQEHCHTHIDELKAMIKDTIESFGISIDKQLEGIRENINTLIRAGLK